MCPNNSTDQAEIKDVQEETLNKMHGMEICQ